MTTLAAALVDIAIRIGRWLLQRLARWAISHVIGYMRGKIEDFKRRRANPKIADWRREFLAGRIQRWTKAVRWIERHSLAFLNEQSRNLCKLPEVRKLPLRAACEVERRP